MIHVCFGLHDKTGLYSKFTGTTMLSMFENHNTPTQRLPSITVHILHDNTLSTDNREKFIYLAGQYGQLVKFYNVEELCSDKVAEIKNSLPNVTASCYSIATFYRFLIPKLFPINVEKVIYLDSDLIVNLDVKELWRIELNDRPLAAVSEHMLGSDPRWFVMCHDGVVKLEDYFNAGVLLMNLNLFRAEELTLINGMRFVAANPRYTFFDQDVLNYCFATKALKLPIKFNLLVRDLRFRPDVHIEKKIYHYAAASIRLEPNDQFNRLWLSYFMKTPWFDEESIGRLYSGFQQIHVGLKSALVNLSAIMSGKTRAFFAPPQDLDGLKKFFSIRNNEKIIIAENQESLNKLLDAMKKAHGKKVFFIMVPNFPFQMLTEAGFVYGKDFIDGLEFLSEAQGIPLNSHPLIQTM